MFWHITVSGCLYVHHDQYVLNDPVIALYTKSFGVLPLSHDSEDY